MGQRANWHPMGTFELPTPEMSNAAMNSERSVSPAGESIISRRPKKSPKVTAVSRSTHAKSHAPIEADTYKAMSTTAMRDWITLL